MGGGMDAGLGFPPWTDGSIPSPSTSINPKLAQTG